MKPSPIAYTATEGGDWRPWEAREIRLFSAVLFDDGSIFDIFGGWRSYTPERVQQLVIAMMQPQGTIQ